MSYSTTCSANLCVIIILYKYRIPKDQQFIQINNTMLETFQDTKGVIRSHKSEKDRQKKKYKRTNNNLQNITQITRDRARRTPLKNQG